MAGPLSPGRVVVVLALAAVAALGAWWAVGSTDDSVAPAGERAAGEQHDEPTMRLAGRREENPADGATPPPQAAPHESAQSSPPASPPPGTLLGRPMVYEYVDAETGRPLAGAEAFPWIAGPSQGPGLPSAVTIAPTTIPEGYASDGTERAPSVVAAVADRLRAVVPLRRAMDVRVVVTAPPTGPREDDIALFWRLGEGDVHEGPELPRGGGEAAIPNVPHLRGEVLEVSAHREADWDGTLAWSLPGDATVEIPDDAEARLSLAIEVPPIPEDGRPHEPTSASPPPPLPLVFPDEAIGHEDAGTGTVVLRVRRRDGALAPAGTAVRLGSREGRTGADGSAVFDAYPALPTTAYLREPGLVPVAVPVVVTRDATTTVEVVEPQGATLDVTVVDEQGRPLPFAVVAVEQASGVPWCDVERQVQRLDPYVDERGGRSFRHVEPGVVALHVWFGSRETRVVLEDVGNGTRVPVRIVLPRVQLPRAGPSVATTEDQ